MPLSGDLLVRDHPIPLSVDYLWETRREGTTHALIRRLLVRDQPVPLSGDYLRGASP